MLNCRRLFTILLKLYILRKRWKFFLILLSYVVINFVTRPKLQVVSTKYRCLSIRTLPARWGSARPLARTIRIRYAAWRLMKVVAPPHLYRSNQRRYHYHIHSLTARLRGGKHWGTCTSQSRDVLEQFAAVDAASRDIEICPPGVALMTSSVLDL